MVVIYHPQVDVTHLEVRRKRQDDQLHQRNQKDDPGQEPVTFDLFEFLFQ